MRYDDASQPVSNGHSEPVARPDVDILPPGSFGPATGNAITGEGTNSGHAGADSVGASPAITQVQGAGGQTVVGNGNFQAPGQYGVLQMDAQGNFNYVRNPNTPDGVKDVFNYTVADASGGNSSTTLTIDIAQVAAAAAGQGVVALPAGVQLSDIHVNGHDLIINMPDGTQMVIPNGAVFVPEITIGDVQVPPTNLAALLIDSEPQPAAGSSPSSGGDWNDPIPPLDPGVPLGDLIPPTELTYTPPTFVEPAGFIHEPPTVVIETPDNPPPGVVDASEQVFEKGLPERDGGKPAGSGEIADGDPNNNSDPSETNTGTIVFTAQGGLQVISVDGVAITQVGQTIQGQYGTMTITGIDLTHDTITYSYTLADNTSGDNTADHFTVVVTDKTGDTATATLTVNIVDDVPTARDDTDSLDSNLTATGNVMTGVGTTSGAAGADTVGADNASLTSVSSNFTHASDATFDSSGNLIVHGEFGTLTIKADGTYSYTLDANSHGGGNDVFTYTITDGDGDTSSATLTIDVPLQNSPPTAESSTVNVSEEGLPGGNPDSTGTPDTTNSATGAGTINASDPDGDPLTIKLTAPTGTYTSHGQVVNWAVSSDGHTLVGYTGSDSTTNHVIEVTITDSGTYSVQLLQAFDDPNPNIEDSISFTVPVTVSDNHGASTGVSITVTVEDDSPVVSPSVNSDASATLDESGTGAGAATIDTGSIVKGDDPDVAGSGAISSATSGSAIVNANVSFGGDGPAASNSLTYALSITNAASGLEVTDGSAITLQMVNGVIVGVVQGGAFNGEAAFAISINSATGVVTVEQYLSLDHPNTSDPNDAVQMALGSVGVTVTATDYDGDHVTSGAVDVSHQITFLDDGPSINPVVNSDATVTLDESGLGAGAATIDTGSIVKGDDPDVAGSGAISSATSGTAVVTANAAFGADGPAVSGSLTYALSITSATSGLEVTDGSAITLQMVNGVIVGVVQGGAFDGEAAFAISINSTTGVVTVEQYLSLDHPNPNDPNDAVQMLTGTVGVTVTATDGDGDHVTSGAVDVSHEITFLDDGPSVSPVVNSDATVTLDESGLGAGTATIDTGSIVKGDDPDVAGSGAISAATSGSAIVTANAAFGADGPAVSGSLTYALSITSATSGLEVTDGSAISLQMVNGVIVGVVQGGAFNGEAAFAISINSTTGVVTVEQYLSLDHPNPNDPNDAVQMLTGTVGVTVTATDGDGDHVTSGAVDVSHEITFLDDGPSVNPVVNSDASVTLDESGLGAGAATINTGSIVKGDDPDVAGSGAISSATSGSAIVTPNAAFGADGPAVSGSLTYALSITNAVSGLEVTDGSAINLQMVNGVIVGVVSGGAFNGEAAFAISINSTTGVVTVEQYLSLDHPNPNDPNDAVLLASGSVGVTVTATDGDGDHVTSGAVDVSHQITFLDDGPSISPVVNADATVTLDESGLGAGAATISTGSIVKGDDPDVAGSGAISSATSGSAIVSAHAAFGADGPAVTGSLTYALSITNAVSGLEVTDGSAINLQLVNGVIVGVVSGGAFNGEAAFAISINSSTGVVTVEQYLSLDHPNTSDPNDAVLLASGSVGVTVTATDGDGDHVTSGAVDVSHQITFLDDGPSVSPVVNADATVTLDESGLGAGAATISTGSIVKGDDPDVAGSGAISSANSGSAIVSAHAAFGADGPAVSGSLTYALSITNAVSGLEVTDGSAINLQMVNGVIVGVVSGGAFNGEAAFAISINSTTGVVTVEQYLSLDHPNTSDPNDAVLLASGSVGVTVTATDGDGDHVTSGAVDVSHQITFLDDGPSVSPVLNATATVLLDESGLGAGAATINTGSIVKGDDPDVAGSGAISSANSGSAVVSAHAAFGADGPAVTGSLTYALSITNAVSGLMVTDGSAINLQMVNGVIVGVVSGGAFNGEAAFAISINSSTGVVTVEQYLSLDHPNTSDPNDAVLLATGSVGVTVTATDGDGDHVTSGAVDVSHQITFLDDGPQMDPGLNASATVTLDESGLGAGAATINTGSIVKGDDPDVTGSGAISSANSGSAVVTANAAFGADGPAVTGSLTYALSITNATSGLEVTDGSAINLQMVNGVIVGVVSGGAFNGEAAFAISINSSTGVVTVEQYLSLDHPNTSDPNDAVQMALGSVGVTVTATDGDGDHVTSGAIDVSHQITFLDDGPSVSPALNASATVALDESGLGAGPATINTGSIVKGDDPDVAGSGAISSAMSGSALVTANALFGADGPALSNSLAYALSITNATSGLEVTDGHAITLQMVNGVIVGVVQGGAFNGEAAFAISINAATGVVTVEQYLSLDHPNTSDPNDIVQLASGSIGVTITATDGDGDHITSGAVDVSHQISFADDGPTLGTVQDQVVSNDPTQTPAVGSLHFAAGADGPGTTMTITADTTGITSGGFGLVTHQVGNVLTAYEDVNHNGVYDSGDTTAVFTITVDPSGGTSGTYTFDLLQALDPTVTPFNIGSGSSFGAGPSQSVVVTDTASGTNLVFVTGWSPTDTSHEFTTGENTAWLGGGDPSLSQTSNVNGSTAGWGLANNNFDAGEFMRFDFGTLDDYDGGGPYTPPGTPTIAVVDFATFSFKNFSTGDTVEFVAHYTDGSTADFVLSDGSASTLTINAPAGLHIAWIDVYESAGSIKLNLDQVGVVTSTVNDTINATVQLTDGDGDPTTTGGFTIQVTDGGTPAQPNLQVQNNVVTTNSVVSTTSLVSSNDNQTHGDHRSFGVGQNAAVMAALAAAGIEAEHGKLDFHGPAGGTGHSQTMTPLVAASAGAASFSSGYTASPTHIVETTSGSTPVEGHQAAGRFHEILEQMHGLGHADAHTPVLTTLLNGSSPISHGSVVHTGSIMASGVAMPSAQQLIAAMGGHAQPQNSVAGVDHSQAVSQVLADALHGGEGHGPSIDGLLSGPTSHVTHDVIEALASHAGSAVPFSNSSVLAAFHGTHNMFSMNGMAHHDAAPHHG